MLFVECGEGAVAKWSCRVIERCVILNVSQQSNFLYSREYLNQPNLSSHASIDWEILGDLTKTQHRIRNHVDLSALMIDNSPINDKFFHE